MRAIAWTGGVQAGIALFSFVFTVFEYVRGRREGARRRTLEGQYDKDKPW